MFRALSSPRIAFAKCLKYSTLKVSKAGDHILKVSINRTSKMNAMNLSFFHELKSCFNDATNDASTRAIVLMAEGENFSSGIDIGDLKKIMMANEGESDAAVISKSLRSSISDLQSCFSAVFNCTKPVIAAVQGLCMGAGVDLVLAADVRLCEKNTSFSIKEVDLGISADLGTLQLLPRAIGSESLCRELILTARTMNANEAKQCGFVSKELPDIQSLHENALEIADTIASKSPIAVQGSKYILNYSRDHSLKESMAHQALWNSVMLQGKDTSIAVKAALMKKTPVYPGF
mmetsp:Transcript_14951/g.21224  ORF Transcript_14951/g.21224 Transcript_14951/m.21224 type:complete len:290 (+) Transcript_14951:128-997(+)